MVANAGVFEFRIGALGRRSVRWWLEIFAKRRQEISQFVLKANLFVSSWEGHPASDARVATTNHFLRIFFPKSAVFAPRQRNP